MRRREQLQSRRVDRQRERDRVSLVLGAHRTRRQHDHFIGIGRDAGVDLGAAHDDTVGALLDDSHVVVGMVLLRGSERAIALDVGLRDGDREIVVAAIAVVLVDALAILGFAGRGEPLADDVQREQRVGADFLDQHDQRRTLARRGCDQRAAFEQVVAVLRNMIVAAVFVAALFHDSEFAILRIVRHPVVERRVLDRDANHRMRGDIRHFLAAEEHRAAVAQRAFVLFSRP